MGCTVKETGLFQLTALETASHMVPITQAHTDIWCCYFPSEKADHEHPVIVSK